MSTSTQIQITAAFCAAIKVIATRKLGGVAVRWPNRSFTVPEKDGHISLDVMVNKAVPRTLGMTGEDEVTGITQVGIHYPQGEGYFKQSEAVEVFRSLFVSGANVVYKGAEVQIQYMTETDPVIENGKYKTYLSIYWMTRIARNVQAANAILSNLDALA